MRLLVFGAGKLGRALGAAARASGWQATVRAARLGWPKRVDAQLVVLAVRDQQLAGVVQELAACRRLPAESVVVHVAGSMGANVLGPLRGQCRGVAQMHPMVAFADARHPPRLQGAVMHIDGDRAAVQRARELALALGMKPRRVPGLNTERYHAAAAILAGGAVAVAWAALKMWNAAGCPEKTSRELAAGLLRAVADNVQKLGVPQALTGPVRRADLLRVRAQAEELARVAPQLTGLNRESLRAQLALARELCDAPSGDLDAIGRILVNAGRTGHREQSENHRRTRSEH